MLSHHGKLLELLAIENKSNYPFLHIKLSFPEDIEVLWKIDEYTADKLRPIAKFDKKYKYRLSLNSSWDGIKKQHISTLTRTYLNQSERVHFCCSENYATQLSSIKCSHGIHDLDMQDFTPMPLEATLMPPEVIPTPLETTHQHERPKNNVIFIYVLLLIMCFLLSMLLGYSGLASLSKISFNKPAVSKHLLFAK